MSLERPQESKGGLNKMIPLHPNVVQLNRNLFENKVIMSSENNTILDTISSNDSRQYSYNSPQMNMNFNNKLRDLNPNTNVPPSQRFAVDAKDERYQLRSIESPQNTAYFVGSSTKNADYSHYNRFQRDQVTPNSLDYSASTDFNAQSFNMAGLQNKNLSLSKNIGNIQNQHEHLQSEHPQQYDPAQFATLGRSPGHQESRGISQDEELESTVFGQSSIIGHTYYDGTTRLSDEQEYFGNMKGTSHPIGSFGGTEQNPAYQAKFQSISSSAESTPNKIFKAGLMAKKHQFGHELMTGYPNQSQETIGRSYDSGFDGIRESSDNNLYYQNINNDMSQDKLSFNPMVTQENYDLAKYSKGNQEGNEIFIENDVHPIAEQSDEDSRRGNTTPMSSETRGGYPVSSNITTPQNYASNQRNEDTSPYGVRTSTTAYDKSNKTDPLPFPRFNDGEKSQGRMRDKENAFDDKQTDLTACRSFMDRNTSNLTHTFRDSSIPEASGKSEDSIVGSHLYQKYPGANFQLSQLSQSIGPYDGTTSKIMSSPAIYERGAESEEDSGNDSQLKMSQLNYSPPKEKTEKQLKFDDWEQPKTGTIGEQTSRQTNSSTLHLADDVEAYTGYK